MLDKKKKEKIIEKYKTHGSDTGSSQVQIAILTEEIKELTKHLKTHKKDFSSRRLRRRFIAKQNSSSIAKSEFRRPAHKVRGRFAVGSA